MEKFTKILEKNSNNNYMISAEIQIIVKAENSGEAGYLADYILGGIEEQYNYNILNIEETSETIKR
jgi:hypothetical protein